MSIIPPALSRLLPFYLSGPMPCPYLPHKVERKLFTRLTGDDSTDAEINATLTRAGFRRSHDIVYRPACGSCTACVPVRIPVAVFTPSRNLRRIMKINRDLEISIAPPIATREHYDLFNAYEKARHPDSDMAHMSWEDFRFMIEEGSASCALVQLRDKHHRLMGCMMTDAVNDGYSAIYSFFAPDQDRRSLGVQLILTLVHEAQRHNLPYIYLGYWIAASRKMAYKARFQPLQALGEQGWDWIAPESKTGEDEPQDINVEDTP